MSYAYAVLAILAPVLGPDADTAIAAAVSGLEDSPECVVPLEEQPYDCPERALWALTSIADREGPGNYSGNMRWVGRHRKDSGHDSGLWRLGHRRGVKGYRRGSLSADCPEHASPIGMSTVGTFGLMYVYNVHRLDVPGNCVSWIAFGSPAIASKAALHRYLERCGGEFADGWCPSMKGILRARYSRCRRAGGSRNFCAGAKVA